MRIGGAGYSLTVDDERTACLDGNSGKAGGGGVLDGPDADGRHIDAAFLAGLRQLDQHTLKRAKPPAHGGIHGRDARQHDVGSRIVFGRDDGAATGNGPLTDIARADIQRRPNGRVNIGLVFRRRCGLRQHRFGCQQALRHLVRADDMQTVVLFEIVGNAAQQTIITLRQPAHQTGQQFDTGEVEPDLRQVRPVDPADQHDVLAAVLLQQAKELAMRADADMRMGKALYILADIVVDRDDEDVSSRGDGNFGKRGRQRPRPATIPSFLGLSVMAVAHRGHPGSGRPVVSGHANRPIRFRANKIDDLHHFRLVGETVGYAFQPVAQCSVFRKENTICLAHGMYPVA